MIGWLEVKQVATGLAVGVAAGYLTLIYFRVRAHLSAYRAWLRANDYVLKVRWEDRICWMAFVGVVAGGFTMSVAPRILGW